MTASVVNVECSDGVAVVTIDRSHARNALNSRVIHDLPRAVDAAAERDDVAAIILTGADPAFCAGLDLKELATDGTNIGLPQDVRWPWGLHHKPVIGAVNGAAVAGGLELALHCDFLVASERAVFADTHSRVGQIPGAGLCILLPQAVGQRRARELSFTGNFFDARQALQWGLVNHVVPHEQLLATARSIAADIVANQGPATRALHHLYEAMQDTVLEDAWRTQDRLAREWQAGFRPAEVAERRGGIMARSREQRKHIGQAGDGRGPSA